VSVKIKNIFRRYEQKYIITPEVAEKVRLEAEKHMTEDEFGETDIMNIYYDTPDNRLIRNSIEKPTVYKEKLRLRCYGVPSDDSKAFIELKKKYESVVYKRRLSMPYKEAVYALETGDLPDTQIGKEIAYFLQFYKTLAPSTVITYRRRAYIQDDFRLTFDSNILYRTEDLDLRSGIKGQPVTDMVILELKSPTAIPFWCLKVLSEHNIRKSPFSKYGTAYKITKGVKY
jgi:SPX domain protein involved in polyphosphate accumulation